MRPDKRHVELIFAANSSSATPYAERYLDKGAMRPYLERVPVRLLEPAGAL